MLPIGSERRRRVPQNPPRYNMWMGWRTLLNHLAYFMVTVTFTCFWFGTNFVTKQYTMIILFE